LYESEREVQTLEFTAKDYLSKVNPSAQELKDFYAANTQLFQSPEYIDVEYIVLKLDPKGDAKVLADKADQFANLTYDQPDSLKPAADKLKLDIQKQQRLTRGGASGLSYGHPLTNPKVIQSLFSDDAVKNKRNIEAVQVSPGIYVSARVIAFHPAQTLAFDEVSGEIKRQVTQRTAEKLATNAAAEKLSALKADPQNSTGFTKAFWISRNKPGSLAGTALDQIMTVDSKQLPAVVSVANPGVGTTLYRIDQVRQASGADPALHKAQAQQIQALAAQEEFAGFMSYWRDAANVKIINPLKPVNTGNAGG
jgi:hypothetical protein